MSMTFVEREAFWQLFQNKHQVDVTCLRQRKTKRGNTSRTQGEGRAEAEDGPRNMDCEVKRKGAEGGAQLRKTENSIKTLKNLDLAEKRTVGDQRNRGIHSHRLLSQIKMNQTHLFIPIFIEHTDGCYSFLFPHFPNEK